MDVLILPCLNRSWFLLVKEVPASGWTTPKGKAMDKYPDSKVHGANMGPIWGRQDPGGPHVGPMNFAIWIISPTESKGIWLQFS